MSFSAIAAAVNLSKATASTIYYCAVSNAQVREPSTLLCEITNELEQLQLEPAEDGSRTEAGAIQYQCVKKAVAGEELHLLNLLDASNLDPKSRSGRPEALTEAEKDHLVATVRRDFKIYDARTAKRRHLKSSLATELS